MEVNCFNCQQIISNSAKKHFIFEKDSAIKRCLVYKINQLTEAECLPDQDESYICGQCRDILINILKLEEDFKDKSRCNKYNQ